MCNQTNRHHTKRSDHEGYEVKKITTEYKFAAEMENQKSFIN